MSARSLLYKVLCLNFFAITLTIILASPFQKVYRQFEDGGFITYFSVIQLFILSYLTYRLFKMRRQLFTHPWKSPAAIWGIASLGFSFLALDDLLMIHEFLDKSIHRYGQLQETGLSDRIDDIIVGGYGLVAIGLLVLYRHEIKKYRVVLPYVIAGFTLLFLMVGVDILTNRDDILLMLFSPRTVKNLTGWLFVPEESFKLFSEACLIVAARTCTQIAQRLTAQEKDARNNLIPVQATVDTFIMISCYKQGLCLTQIIN